MTEVVDETERETPLAAFRRSAGFQIMFVLHSGLEVGRAIDHLCASAEKFRAASSEWQPIDTAPKTGETILIGHGNSVWEDEWSTDGYWLRCIEGGDGDHENEVPTHWMPLPEPPKIES